MSNKYTATGLMIYTCIGSPPTIHSFLSLAVSLSLAFSPDLCCSPHLCAIRCLTCSLPCPLSLSCSRAPVRTCTFPLSMSRSLMSSLPLSLSHAHTHEETYTNARARFCPHSAMCFLTRAVSRAVTILLYLSPLASSPSRSRAPPADLFLACTLSCSRPLSLSLSLSHSLSRCHSRSCSLFLSVAGVARFGEVVTKCNNASFGLCTCARAPAGSPNRCYCGLW